MNFIKRYWHLLILVGIGLFLITNNTLFQVLGTEVYIPAIASIKFVTALLFRNMFNRDTTDKYVKTKQFTQDFWSDLSPKERVILTHIQFWVYLIFLGLVVLAVG